MVVTSSGVTRAAGSTAAGMGATALPSPSASAGEAPFVAENSAAMVRMMSGMDLEPTGDVDHDFVAMMVPHHQGAIDMAETELHYGRNEQLRRIAQQIIVEQLQEIAAMRIAVGERVGTETAGDSLEAEAPFVAENKSAMTQMMKGMTITPSGDVDRDFVAMMVPHHRGAIDMAEAELRHGGSTNTRLRLIAQEIIVDQMQEIALMHLAIGEALPPSIPSPTDRSPALSGIEQRP